MLHGRMHGTLHTILAELRGRFEVLYGSRLLHLVLYGSQARDDATPDSDIDVLVVLQGPVQPSKDQLWLALHDYGAGPADFSDYLLGRLGTQAGCTETLTFDTSLKNSPHFRLL